ncbi:MAG: tyrosine-type recombinase/integrase [Terriglobales bacterium]
MERLAPRSAKPSTASGVLSTGARRVLGRSALRTSSRCVRRAAGDIRSLRNKAIILLGFAGGFRRSEIVSLNIEDLEFKNMTLRVTLRRSKTAGFVACIIFSPQIKPFFSKTSDGLSGAGSVRSCHRPRRNAGRKPCLDSGRAVAGSRS